MVDALAAKFRIHSSWMASVQRARLYEAVCCGLDNDISEMKGIENAGVEDGNRWLKRHGAA
jgi:hypothetical protein